MKCMNANSPKICMIVQQRDVRGGIAAVTEGYYNSKLEDDYAITFIESYCNGSKIKKLNKFIKAYFCFRKVLAGKNKPALVHMHTSFGPSFYRSIPFVNLCCAYNIPIINHIHGAEFDSFYLAASDSKKRLVRKIYNKCTFLIVLSKEWKQNISMITDANKIEVIENYSVPMPVNTIKPLFSERFNKKQVLFLGEIGQRKGGFDIPEVIANVCTSIPDAKFVIAGDGNIDDISKIQSLIPSQFAANVSFPGWVRGTAKEKLLRESAVYFLPSYQEGMPMSVLDAMGYGLPIVSTNVGGIPKLVETNVNGKLCKPGDVSAMSLALIEILSNKNIQTSEGISSLNIIENKYSLNLHIKKLEQLYQQLLD